MKKLLIVLSLGAIITSMPLTALSVDTAITKGTVNASYSAEKEVSPDTVEVSIAVKTSDKKSMQIASSKNKEISNNIYEYLKNNINPANGDYIKTSNYNASPIYRYDNGKQYLDRYEVSNNVVIHTKSIDKIANLIDKSLEMGATNVNSLNFSLSQKDNECTELLAKAATQMKKRANVVATALNSSVTGVKDIHTSCSVNQPSPRYGFTRNMLMAKSVGAAEDAAIPTTSIESGTIKVYATVDGTFYLK